jgi:P pilus assembly protein, porin PapC
MATFFSKGAIVSGMLLAVAGPAGAKQPLFNSALLEIDHPSGVDIHQFDKANSLPPGDYKVDIFVNGNKREPRVVTFIQQTAEAELTPCFTDVAEVLKSLGVKVDALKTLKAVDPKLCAAPEPLIEGSAWVFDADKLVLNITIPQLWLDMNALGYISPSRWDEGITALMTNYDFSGSHTLKTDYDDEPDNYYLNLQNGLNYGAWRLRNYSTLNAEGGNAEYHAVSTWVQRDIAAIRSQIMMGDTWTASDIFDGTRIRGARLYTDNDMLPASMNGFAPVVRGVAKSNATVIIKQNGYIIYQSAVPPGAFAISDLNTTSSGGDLDVTVREEDGSEQNFTQPFASLAILKREGQTDFDLSLGELREESRFTPDVLQAQILHGFQWGMTAYGGGQISDNYASAALGFGKDLGNFGAISADVTHARATFNDGEAKEGQSYRILYSKRFDETQTNFRLVGYRYSTQGYYTLSEWASRQSDDSDFWLTGNRRSRLEGTWTQSFGRHGGNIYLTLSRQQYWLTDEVERLIQMGYSNNLGRLSWNVSWNYTDSSVHSSSTGDSSSESGSENIIMFSLSVPLSGWIEDSYVNYALTQNAQREATHQIGVGGTLLERNNLSYNLQQSYDENDRSKSSNLAVGWDGTYGSLSGSYATSENAQRLNYGARGGILVHSDGITLAQELGETVALVKAPGAAGLAVENTSGVATDWRGYTVKTQLNPYSENRVAIDSDYFSKSNIELENSVINIVPTRGAIVKAEFVTHVGYRVLFNVNQKNGQPVPFGAIATGENGAQTFSGIVGERGQLYLSGIPEEGSFSLRWGSDNSMKCQVPFSITSHEATSLIQQSVICQ